MAITPDFVFVRKGFCHSYLAYQRPPSPHHQTAKISSINVKSIRLTDLRGYHLQVEFDPPLLADRTGSKLWPK
jgi:hypothetical protein